MIIQLEKEISQEEEQKIQSLIASLRLQSTKVVTTSQIYLIVNGSAEYDLRSIGVLPGVKDLHVVHDSYQLVSRAWKTKGTEIELSDGVFLGEKNFQCIAGPCSVESEDQIQSTVDFLHAQGIQIMRGGVFKPRTSPYSFRGMGLEGLKMFSSIARSKGIKIITEILEPAQMSLMEPYVDIFQVGARNSQNFSLLNELGKTNIPVLLKRGISGTIEELLQSAEYIFSAGNEKIILCERGIRSFESAYRNTLDLNAVPLLKEKSHLPVVVDPSHGIGIRRFVGAMALAGVAAGANGILMEVHPNPDAAQSDKDQTIGFEEAANIFSRIKALRGVL